MPQRDSPLFAAYFEKRADLVRFFTLRLRSAEAAEDLVQDLFVKLQTINVDTIERPAAYLYRLGWNLMLDGLRQGRRSASRDGDWTRSRLTHLANQAVAEEPAADQVVAARERLARILSAIEQLPPQTRRVFRLHKLDGLSHAEVANRLSISRSAVEKHVSAALRHLLERDL